MVRALPCQQLRLIVVQQADRGQSLTSQACPAPVNITAHWGGGISEYYRLQRVVALAVIQFTVGTGTELGNVSDRWQNQQT